MNSKYFNLGSECYLINGKSRAVIHNLLKKEIIWLDRIQTDIITKAEAGELIDADNSFLCELQKHDWGFFSEKKYYIDKLRTKNLFIQKKYYKDKPNILAATIQLTNSCNLECDFCGKLHCPVCHRLQKNVESIPLQKVKDIVLQLRIYGLQYIMLTGGEVALYPDIQQLLEYLELEQIKTIIYTNGTEKIEGIHKNAELYIYIYDVKQVQAASLNYKDSQNVTLINYTNQNLNYETNWRVINQSKERAKMELKHIQKLGLMEFDLNKYNNACLNSRIYINANLDVIPCFGSSTVIGNIDQDNFMDIVMKLYNKVWNKNKINSEENIKCKQCEFRFGCTNCNSLGKVDEYCSYDVEVGQWK